MLDAVDYERAGSELQPMLGALNDVIGLADAAAADLRSGEGSPAALRFFAARSAVNRADDVYALLRTGAGGVVAAAQARGLLEQACREAWLGVNSPDGEARLVSLGQERRR